MTGSIISRDPEAVGGPRVRISPTPASDECPKAPTERSSRTSIPGNGRPALVSPLDASESVPRRSASGGQ